VRATAGCSACSSHVRWCWQRQQAQEILHESLAQVESLWGSNHWQSSALCMGLALVHVEQGRAREALACAKRAALLAYEAFGAKSARGALVQSAVAQVLVLQGSYIQATHKLRGILDLKTRAGWSARHWSVALDRYALAQASASLGRFPEALQLAELATDSVVQQAAGERERAAGTLVGIALRARIMLQQGLVRSAAILARSVLSHHLCAPSRMSSLSSPSHTFATAAGSGGKTGVASGPADDAEDRGDLRQGELQGLEDQGTEMQTVCIAAHLVLTQVCRIRGEHKQAVEHASSARTMAQARYTAAHPVRLEAALEWARAYTELGPTLTAHLEAEAVLLAAEDALLAEYASVPPAAATPAPAAHPLLFRLWAAKAQMLSASNRHASAVEHARKASAGVDALLAGNHTPDAVAASWMVAQAQLDLARCLLQAGLLMEALLRLSSFFLTVDQLWKDEQDADENTTQHEQEEPVTLDGGGKEGDMSAAPEQMLAGWWHGELAAGELAAAPDQNQAGGEHQERSGGQKRDARLHKLGFARDTSFVWHEDEEGGSGGGADGGGRADGGRFATDGLAQLVTLHQHALEPPSSPVRRDTFRFSTLAALVERGDKPALINLLSFHTGSIVWCCV
jgi:tetratricopeptide (TPR) repeat protein